MKRVSLLFSLAALLCSAQAPKQFARRSLSDEFVGAWKPISFERRIAAGDVSYPMGQNPVGRITYDGSGRMSAQIMRPDRPKYKAASPAAMSAEEKVSAFDGFIAYYGTYSVSETERVVIHHVGASLYPNWVGSDQRRLYEFSGGRLIGSAQEFDDLAENTVFSGKDLG